MKFKLAENDFFVIIKSKQKIEGKLWSENIPENRLRTVFDLIKANKKITVSKIAKELNVNKKTVKRDIAKLKQKELLKKIGPAKGGYWKIGK